MRTRIIIFFIILITLALRLFEIDQKNLWFDEIYSWYVAQGTVIQIIAMTSGDIHPPFYYIVLKFWIQIFSDSIFSMRMLSVTLSILSIYFIYRISKMFFKNDLWIILVLLMYAVSPLNIYYSQEVRMLNLNLFLCLGSVYYFYVFLKNASYKTGALYITFTALALYTHYFALLILLSELAIVISFYLIQKHDKKIALKYSVYFLIINLLFAPWYPVFFRQISAGQPWRTNQSLKQTGLNVLDFFKDIFLSTYYTFESNAVFYFSQFFGMLLVTFLFYSVLKKFNSKKFFSDRLNSVILLFYIPLVIAIIVSFRQSILLSRYLSILLPFLFIMIVYTSLSIYGKRTTVAIAVLLILTSCFGTYINFNNDFKNNDYRKIMSYLEKNYEEGDQIIVEPHFMGWSINYYLKNNDSRIKAPEILGWDLNMQLDSLKNISDSGQNDRIWFLLDYSSLETTEYDSLSILMNKIGYDKLKEKTFYLIPAKVKVEYYDKRSHDENSQY